MTVRRSAFALLVPLALVLAACGSGGGSDGGEAAPSTTTTEASVPADPAYQERGPHQVGVQTVALSDGRRAVIWYPAADEAKDQPKEVFDIASLLSPDLQAQIPAEIRPQYEIDAHPGAPGADGGPFPLVGFSHGFAGYPEQSADLVVHLASWGFVVVAPDHVERSLSGLLGTAAQGIEPREDPDVLSEALDAAVAEAERDGSPLAGLVDDEQVAVAGHSAGASAAYLTASSDDRVDAFIAYSLGQGRPAEDGTVVERPVPDVAGMVMLGTTDGIIEADATREVYEGMDAPKVLVEIADAGHLVFSDICLIGRDRGGLVGLIAEAGLDLPENLLRLASDGCEEDALDPATAFPAIDHLSVSFLRSALGIDEEPVGLDQATADGFAPVEVTVSGEEGP